MNSNLKSKYGLVVASALFGLIASAGATIPAEAPPSSLLSLSLKNMMAVENLDPEGDLDPFAPPKRWVPQAEPHAAAPAKPIAEDFKNAHVLSALMQSSNGGVAIINGRLLKIGDVIDGYKLISISRTRAALANQSGRLELQMVAPSDKADVSSTN